MTSMVVRIVACETACSGRGDDGIRETLFLSTVFSLCDFAGLRSGGMAALGRVCTDLKREVLDIVEGEMEGERA